MTAQPADYQVPALATSIPAGSLTGSIFVRTADDALDEDDQTVVLVMGFPVNAIAGTTAMHTVTIVDDDATPRCVVRHAVPVEHHGVRRP